MNLKILQESCAAEKHDGGVLCVIRSGNVIYTGSEDCKIKAWTADLKLIREIETNCGGVLSLASANGILYSCGSDQTIQSWNAESLQNLGQVSSTLLAPLKLYTQDPGSVLWAGDAQGNVAKFEDNKETGKFELVEEVWDLIVTADPTLIYTGRDRDIVVTEIVPGINRSKAVVKATIEGRYPITITGDKFCCLDRTGKNIVTFENSLSSRFKKLKEITAADVILNTMTSKGDGETLYAGGYDNSVTLWNIKDGEKMESIDLKSCVNAMCPSASNGAYVGLADGRLILVGV